MNLEISEHYWQLSILYMDKVPPAEKEAEQARGADMYKALYIMALERHKGVLERDLPKLASEVETIHRNLRTAELDRIHGYEVLIQPLIEIVTP